MEKSCPFCARENLELVWSNPLAVAFRDAYPVTEGHTLVISRRHVPEYFLATPWEQQAIWEGVVAVQALLKQEFSPAGFNVGFNAGEVAGQTVMHLHVHVIPRRKGDSANPRGGVRGVIPAKQNYGEVASEPRAANDPFTGLASFVPGEEEPFLPNLLQAMKAADQIDIVAAFIQHSGLVAIEELLVERLERGAQVRILTGDYLNVTHPHALQSLFRWQGKHEELQARFYRVPRGESFHPKAYLFRKGSFGAAFVGSSNLSYTGLTHGVEWNVLTASADQERLRSIQERFERLFNSPYTQPLDAEVVREYQAKTPVPAAPEPAVSGPIPHEVQQDVLAELKTAREDGARRGLVILATGLGKTYLSAFDFKQFDGERALFVAHREEILEQAAATWAKVLPNRTIGFLTGDRKEPDVEFLFASVQTLAKRNHLRQFAPRHFDYIVIDEFHHAAAQTYRRLLGHFAPGFLLGLTATPDRMDGASLVSLCDDNVVATVGITEGIAKKLLVPFRYFGVVDEIDFDAIPWRSSRFDAEELTRRYETRVRAEQALREFRKRTDPTEVRALIFCCSRTHADFMAQYLSENGISAASVHSGPTSDSRSESLRRLRTGGLQALCAVDIFNEGVDLPDINAIMLLRPTESPIVFLQQLGRGLRVGQNTTKSSLTVIDFIGNHRSFLVKAQALVLLTGQDGPPGSAIRVLKAGNLDLPEGCSVELELEAINMLEKLARLSSEDSLLANYLSLRESHGRRPTAGELFASGVNFRPVRQRFPSWFDFVDDLHDTTPQEKRILVQHRDWFQDLLRTQMSRSYKMITLQVLVDLDALHGEISVEKLALCCRDQLREDGILRTELEEHDSRGSQDSEFVRSWKDMPLRIFHEAKGFQHRWFALAANQFGSQLDVAAPDRETFDAMTLEMVDLRLREHRYKLRNAKNVLPMAAPIILKVSHTNRNPILRFDRKRRPDIPWDDVSVWVESREYIFLFKKIAVNVVRETPGGANVLPQLMRDWFSPNAGHPGTHHTVELKRSRKDVWTLHPGVEWAARSNENVRGRVPFFESFKVACGYTWEENQANDEKVWIQIQASETIDPKRFFVVRASGDSMDGGSMPIHDGDLVLCEWSTESDPGAVEGEVCLLAGGEGEASVALLKIPEKRDNRWWLVSQNPAYDAQLVQSSMTLRLVALARRVVEERRYPELWGEYDRDAIASFFGYENNPSWRVGHRDVEVGEDEHTILMVNLRKPDNTPTAHQYSDRFLSPSEFQWESQAPTSDTSKRATRIFNHTATGRSIHLFVRYKTKTPEGTAEPYVYCGMVNYLRHQGSKPVRIWYALETPLPRPLWQAWQEIQ